jgi:hypothetical protein
LIPNFTQPRLGVCTRRIAPASPGAKAYKGDDIPNSPAATANGAFSRRRFSRREPVVHSFVNQTFGVWAVITAGVPPLGACALMDYCDERAVMMPPPDRLAEASAGCARRRLSDSLDVDPVVPLLEQAKIADAVEQALDFWAADILDGSRHD